MNAAVRVIAYLDRKGVVCALIGGVALGAHGIARATLDADLLVADGIVLTREFWRGLTGAGLPEIRRGDADDPLGGVVRFAGDTESVDVLLGRGLWTSQILARRIRLRVQRRAVPVVDRADLVGLKLFAGGPQDLLDVRLLVEADPALTRVVESRLGEAPRSVRQRWRRLMRSSRSPRDD